MTQLTELRAKKISVVSGDLPEVARLQAKESGIVAWDIETSGLSWAEDSIGTCQIYVPGKVIYIVRTEDSSREVMKSLLEDSTVTKVFHHALFDLRFMAFNWGFEPQGVACTKIVSKIICPDNEKHGLQHLLNKYLGVSISKSLQTSDWLADSLSQEQLNYAASDVLFLTDLLSILAEKAEADGIMELVLKSFEYIPTRVALDIRGSGDVFTY